MKKIIFLSIILLTVSVSFTQTATAPATTPAAATPAVTTTPATAPADTATAQPKLDGPSQLAKALEDALRQAPVFQHHGRAVAVEALAHIGTLQSLQKSDPKSPEIPYLFSICSLLTEAALLHLQAQSQASLADSTWNKRLAVQRSIVEIQREINLIESGFASTLQANLMQYQKELAEERRKAQERQDEARAKFDLLQSRIVQVRKDARGIILSMSDILFEVGKAELTPDLRTTLARIAGILSVYKESRVLVEGHTDNVGTEAFNQTLSEARANNVMQFLISQGLDAGRFKSKGYAFSRPVAPNTTPEGRQRNRRVDLVIQDQLLKE